MAREELKRHLDRLRAELAAAPELDDETRRTLEAVADDIARTLEGRHDEPHTVRERVEGATVRFEAEHPRFARVLSEVTDALAKIGV
ncbi:MAG TPA: DUF4404 family protein [Gammaproteobacteria bacterium]